MRIEIDLALHMLNQKFHVLFLSHFLNHYFDLFWCSWNALNNIDASATALFVPLQHTNAILVYAKRSSPWAVPLKMRATAMGINLDRMPFKTHTNLANAIYNMTCLKWLLDGTNCIANCNSYELQRLVLNKSSFANG